MQYLFICNVIQEYGVKVIAIDLSSNMVQIAIKRAEEEGVSAEVSVFFLVFF